jgi:hypothetical protein
MTTSGVTGAVALFLPTRWHNPHHAAERQREEREETDENKRNSNRETNFRKEL